MRSRVTALVLALVVAGAPSALVACELMCEARDVQSSNEHTHSCHETQPGSTRSVSGGLHVCGHSDGLPDASSTLTTQGAPAPAVVAIALMPRHDAGRAPLDSLAVTPSPPDRLKLTTQLRI